MCLFQTDTYLCGCPVKVSAFPQQAAGQRKSQPTSTAGECEEPDFHDYSNTIPMTEEDEMELQNMLDLSVKQTQNPNMLVKDNNYLPVLGAIAEGREKEAEEKYQQDYESSESGIKVLRLL